jgi:cytochrome c peroxidase
LSVPEAAARVDLDETSLRQALASYVRTILSGDSPYDRYVAGAEVRRADAGGQDFPTAGRRAIATLTRGRPPANEGC